MDYIERIYNEMNNETASIWYVHTTENSKIIVKAPNILIKSILKGCKVVFLYGKDYNYFHIGISIYDNPTNPVNIYGINRYIEEHQSLYDILQNHKTIIEFYNELDICVLHGFLSINKNNRLKILNFLGNIETLYSGKIDDQANYSLDCFEYSLDNTRKINKPRKIDILKVDASFSKLTILNNHFIGFNEFNQINLDDINEGSNFEKQIWITLDNIFKFNLYKNPEFSINSKKREFTDILAFYEKGIFLIETKAMAILSIDNEQTIKRKAANVQKQIIKAINQLIGAKKILQKNTPIFDKKGKEIEFDKHIIPHCIVLVNELVPFGDWDKVELKIAKTIVEENILLNVFEFSEFMKHIKICSGKKELFDYHLIERTKAFIKYNCIFLKARIVDEKI